MQAVLPQPTPDGRAGRVANPSAGTGDAGQEDDIDTRIRRAEQNLIARDERVLQQVKALGQRLKRARDPQRWAVPAGAAVVALLGAWWLWRHHGPSAAARRQPVPAGRRQAQDHEHAPLRAAGTALGLVGAGRLLMRWLPVLWPMIPARWRPPVNPASATSLLAFGLQLARRRRLPAATAALRTAAHVDLRRYAGTWYEIARLPEPHEEACRDQPRATYTPRGQQLEVLNRCRDAHGEERRVRGVATVQPGSGNAKLKVSFAPPLLHWLPMVWADYWILYVDADYQVALVGNPARDRLWLLARQPTLEPAALRAVVDVARVQGFPTDQLQPSQRV